MCTTCSLPVLFMNIQKKDFPAGVVPLLRGTSVSLNIHPPGMYVCAVELLNHMVCTQ